MDKISIERPSFPGDGSVRFVEDVWVTCEEEKQPKNVYVSELVYRMRQGKLVYSNKQKTDRRFSCNDLTACPFVYVGNHRQFHFVGEILRNLRGRETYALQSLRLPKAHSQTLNVRIAEEKPETTHLDEIYLLVDGKRLDPATCKNSKSPAYCLADHDEYLLNDGDVLDLIFAIPKGAQKLQLFARGYYVPSVQYSKQTH